MKYCTSEAFPLSPLNKSDLLEEVIKEIPKVREDFGFPPLVTPVSQIVGAQALMNVSENKPYETLSKETINLLTGHYGRVPGNVNKEILKKAYEKNFLEKLSCLKQKK